MSESVIADDVSAPRNLPDDIRPLLHESSDQKESSSDIVLPENVQQSKRVRIIGPIVKGKSQIFASARQAAKCPPKPLPRRRNRLISQRTCRGSSGSGDGKAKHGGIVKEHSAFSTQPNLQRKRLH